MEIKITVIKQRSLIASQYRDTEFCSLNLRFSKNSWITAIINGGKSLLSFLNHRNQESEEIFFQSSLLREVS